MLVVGQYSHVDSSDERACRDACDSVRLEAAESGLPVLRVHFYSDGELVEAEGGGLVFSGVAEAEVAEDGLFGGGVAWDARVGGVEELVSREDAGELLVVAG